MDGFLNQKSVDLIKLISKKEDVKVVVNTYKPYTSVPCSLTIDSKRDAFMMKIVNQTKENYDSQQRTAIACMGKKKSAAILQKLLGMGVAREQIVYLHGEDTTFDSYERSLGFQYHLEYKTAVLPNISQVMSDKLILLYTSTITSGVDIQQPFKNTFAWVSKRSVDAM